MHCPLYFLPGVEKPEQLAETPLAELCADVPLDQLAHSVLERGPSGDRGLLFGIPPEGKSIDEFGYFAAKQEWNPTAESVWVGWSRQWDFSPKTLERASSPVSASQVVAMADGTLWDVPVLREPLVSMGGRDVLAPASTMHGTSLKSAMFRDENGNWLRVVAEQYRDLFEQSRQWFDWLMSGAESGQPVSFCYVDVFEYCLKVLGLKYRIGLNLNDAVKGRWLQTDECQQILAVSCGWSVITKLMQKKSLTRT